MTDPIIEAMARAMCVSDCGDVGYWTQYVTEAKAAYLAALPMIAAELIKPLRFGTCDDASLNLQGALHDLTHKFAPGDGGACARTLERVIDQIEAIRILAAAKAEELSK